MEKQPNNYQEWRDEKATQLKKIEDHKERKRIWEEYMKDDVPFAFTFQPDREVDKYETQLANNINIFNFLPYLRDGLNAMKKDGDWSIDYDSREQRSFMKFLAEKLDNRFKDAGLHDIDELGKNIALKFFLECLKFNIVDDLDKLEDPTGKYKDEIFSLTSHYMSKILTCFPKTNRFKEDFFVYWQYFRDKINNGANADDLEFLKEYNSKTKEMIDNFLQSPEMSFNIEEGLKKLESMILDLENKIDKNLAV